MEQKKLKRRFWGCLGGIIIMLISLAGITVLLDPYFHFHGPLTGVSYRLREERYTNPGIVKNYDYDALIIGTSMVKNFKTSQMNELFGVSSVKTPIPGAMYGDMNDLLKISFAKKEIPQMVLLSLDLDRLVMPYTEKNNELVPYYLYDENILNDVSYVWNKEILIRDVFVEIIRTIRKEPSMTLDEYSSFQEITGKEQVLSQYQRPEEVKYMIEVTEEEKEKAKENIEYNILPFVEEYSETKFIFFVPPYSMIYWDNVYRRGELQVQLEVKEEIIKELLQYENVEVYCFNEKEEWITDLDYYIDDIHYNSEISEEILNYIANKEYRITNENLGEHMEKEKNFLMKYSYDKYFEE